MCLFFYISVLIICTEDRITPDSPFICFMLNQSVHDATFTWQMVRCLEIGVAGFHEHHYTSYQNINLQRPDPVGDKRSYVYGDKNVFLIYWEVEDWGRVTQKSRPNSPVRNTDGASSPVKSPLVLSSKRSQRPTAKTPVPASWGNKQKISYIQGCV